MSLAQTKEKDFFEEFGLSVTTGDVVVGQTYPVYGMITKILDDKPGDVKVELNFGITARMNVSDAEGIDTLKERLFESGIFVSTVLAKNPSIEVACQTVIFGRRQGCCA